MERESLVQQLQAFGLTPVEAAIYLHLVNKPPKTMLELASELNLPRTSIYDNAFKLTEKGLVSKVVTYKSQKLRAYPLEILQVTIDKEKARVDDMATRLSALQANLAHTAALPGTTEVRYYSGTKGFQQMMWNSTKADDKGVVGYSQFGRVEVVGESFVRKHVAEMVRRGVWDRVIANPERLREYLLSRKDPISKNRGFFQNIRSISSKRLYITGDTSIYNNVFAIAYWKQGEVVGVEIENAELAKSQRSLFELMWSLADSFETAIDQPEQPDHGLAAARAKRAL